MIVREIVDKLNLKVINLADEKKEVKNGYCGDLLSFVMGRMEPDSAWLTVMNNINVAGVAVLAECPLVILCEKTKPDKLLEEKIKSEKINLCISETDIYNTAFLLHRILK